MAMGRIWETTLRLPDSLWSSGLPVTSDSIRLMGQSAAKGSRSWSAPLGSRLPAILDGTSVTCQAVGLMSSGLHCELPLETCLWQTEPV